jgi:GNAT superfamily N-acetyltransferase
VTIAERARAFHHGRHAAVCDVIEPWEHGTVARSTRHSSYHAYNLVRVEDEPGMTARELADFADEALAGLAHRRIEFELASAGDTRRDELETLGFQTARTVWMHHDATPPAGLSIAVEDVPYDDVEHLRRMWYRDDRPDDDPAAFFAEARAVSLSSGAQVLAVREDGVAVAYGQLERSGACALITAMYTREDRRGRGLGAAIVLAAIAAAGDGGDLWIEADDEERAKPLYERLGFRPAWTLLECTLWPS